MASQFDKLDLETRHELGMRVELRMLRFLALQQEDGMDWPKEILIVGDRPAPSAKVVPENATLHYTPFGAHRHSSLYVNLSLHNGDIPEHRLTWINRADVDGNPATTDVTGWQHVIALGNEAERFLEGKVPFSKVPHPAYWKRFHQTPYPLIEMLQKLLKVQ